MNKFSLLVVAALVALSGCASVAVSSDALEQRTATALGLERGSFTISNRSDSGQRTDYVVTTSRKKYNCYVTGVVAITGKVVSDPICSEIGGRPAAASSSSCNDLLRAAGKCK